MRRLVLLITIFTVAVLVVAGAVIGLLYRAALSQQAALLAETVDSEVHTIDGMAWHEGRVGRFVPDSIDHGDAFAATLDQLRYVHSRFHGLGNTGEFALARREGDSIVYLLSQRKSGPKRTEVIPFDGPAGEPMRRAIAGLTGTVIGPDYRGVQVLAAYEPVATFGIGVVAKVDMAEVRAPFVRAGILSIVVALAVVLLGSTLFYAVTNPVFKQRRASEARLRAILESAKESIWLLGTDGRVLVVNETAAARLGRPAASVVGHDLREVLPDDVSPGRLERILEVVDSHAPSQFEDERDGMTFHHTFYPVMGEDGRVSAVAAFSRDITDRRRAEEKLNRAMSELKRSNAELEQFAYVASHDLKQPLRMVANYTELLAMRYRGKLDDRADRYIDYAASGARQMQAMIDALLLFSRANAQARAFAPVDLGAAARRARANLSFTLAETGAQVEVSPLPTVYGVEPLLVELFQNLFDNALKFRSATPPLIRVSASRTDGRHSAGPLGVAAGAGPGAEFWQVAVADNGIGIEPQHRERVFRLFERLHTDDKYPGTGIGLAVCRRIVESHGGAIWIESEPGRGSCFNFTLPERTGPPPA
jgi:PAS domain S-box-containing protein